MPRGCLRRMKELSQMEFHIFYCKPCGYRERAEELATELRGRFDAQVTIEEGGFGQFDVLLDGEVVASKGGFWKRMITHGAPQQPQILEAIERALADREGDRCETSQSGSVARGER
jgi:selT/selW/selH-like putative selenoprotein